VIDADVAIRGSGAASHSVVKSTPYFEEQVLRKRPYIRREWCERTIRNPLCRQMRPDGRIRFTAPVPELENRVLRVITLADGETIHNAFFDRRFAVGGPRSRGPR
jgi:hypothetical protein